MIFGKVLGWEKGVLPCAVNLSLSIHQTHLGHFLRCQIPCHFQRCQVARSPDCLRAVSQPGPLPPPPMDLPGGGGPPEVATGKPLPATSMRTPGPIYFCPRQVGGKFSSIHEGGGGLLYVHTVYHKPYQTFSIRLFFF